MSANMSRDPFNGVGLKEQRFKQEQDRAVKDDIFKASLINVLNTASGQVVLARLIDESGYFNTVFDKDPMVMAYRAGREDFAKTVANMVLRHCPELFQKLKG